MNIPGLFTSDEIGFVCDLNWTDASLPNAKNVPYSDFGERLVEEETLPDLGPAPVSAWILARLAKLCGSRFPFDHGQVFGSDGDDYWIRFIALTVTGDTTPIGKLSIAGDRESIRLYVHAAPPFTPVQLRDAFMAALLDGPSDLKRFEIIVVYTSLNDENHWQHTPYTLGWDGNRFVYHDSPEHTTSDDDYEKH